MQDAGKYLIKTFYEDDIELARKKESPKNESLNQLIKRLQNRSASSPSKSWIYQSIGLVIQEHDMEGEKYVFQTFGRLSLSHKLSLISVTNTDSKKALITAVVEEKLSVRELEKRKKELQGSSERTVGFLSILNDPDKFLSDDAKGLVGLPALKKEPLNKLNKYKKRATLKYNECKTRIEELQEEIEKQKSYAKGYQKLIPTIDNALNMKKSAKKSSSDKKGDNNQETIETDD